MIAGVAVALWHAGPVLALGAGGFLSRAGQPPAGLRPWLGRVRWALAGIAAISLLAGIAVLAVQAILVIGQLPDLAAPSWRVLVAQTRYGQVWLCKQLLLLLLAAALVVAARRRTVRAPATTGLAAVFLIAGVWSGHGATAAPLPYSLLVHATHGVVAASWLGALPVWAWLAYHADGTPDSRAYLGHAIAQFSRWATVAIAVVIATGVLAARLQFARWPALFGTVAGAWLAAKLVCIAIALWAAQQLRRHFLARLAAPHDRTVRRAALRLILTETLAATTAFVFALQLARTTPGAHDAIQWWLPLRFAPASAFGAPGVWWRLVIACALASAAVAAHASARWRSAAVAAASSALVAVYALSVPAYPDTYRQPAVAYSVHSIVAGARLFEQHCAVCHGSGGRGADQAQSASATRLPIDLSEHTALHTAGDMFWWLGHGIENTGMPGFAAQLSDAERWDLINFLRAFADGFRARVLTPRSVSRQPWLGAPNFRYETAQGRAGELKDLRERQMLLLVLARPSEAAERLGALARSRREFMNHDTTVLVVPLTETCRDVAAVADLACIVFGGDDVAQAYQFFGRTLANAGSRHALSPVLGHGEFLIDRFGYLRARWLPEMDSTGWSVPGALEDEIARLAAEPRIRDAPDEHVH